MVREFDIHIYEYDKFTSYWTFKVFFDVLFFYSENGFLLVKFFSCIVYRVNEICFTEKKFHWGPVWEHLNLISVPTEYTYCTHSVHASGVTREPARELTGIWFFWLAQQVMASLGHARCCRTVLWLPVLIPFSFYTVHG